jgi:hypothetical protein
LLDARAQAQCRRGDTGDAGANAMTRSQRFLSACVSGVLAASIAAGANAQSPSYNQDRHVPIARAQAGDGMVVLFDHSFECSKGKRALYVNHFMAAWLGCWTTTQGQLRIEFEDGEVVTGPAPSMGDQERPQRARPQGVRTLRSM